MIIDCRVKYYFRKNSQQDWWEDKNFLYLREERYPSGNEFKRELVIEAIDFDEDRTVIASVPLDMDYGNEKRGVYIHFLGVSYVYKTDENRVYNATTRMSI